MSLSDREYRDLLSMTILIQEFNLVEAPITTIFIESSAANSPKDTEPDGGTKGLAT